VVVALMSGGGLVALIELVTRGLIRARVYRDFRSYRIVALADEVRRNQIEATLVAQGQPTALVEVEWWNAGRRASDDTEVKVAVPGRVVSFDATENPEASFTTPVQLAQHGVDSVKAQKARLNPRGRCRVVVGYTPSSTATEGAVTVLAYEGKRELGTPEVFKSWVGGLVVVIAFGAPFAVAFTVLLEPFKAMKGWGLPVFFGVFIAWMWLLGKATERFMPSSMDGPSWGQKRKG
jgi:hypothetical protein